MLFIVIFVAIVVDVYALVNKGVQQISENVVV